MRELGIVDGLPFTLDEKFKFDPIINRFLWQLPSGRRASRNTWKAYSQSISMFMRFLAEIDLDWRQVKAEDLSVYHRLRRLSNAEGLEPVGASTWNSDFVAIKLFYDWARDEEIIDKVPYRVKIRTIHGKKLETTSFNESKKIKDIKYISPIDFKAKVAPALLDSRNGLRDESLGLFLIATGARISEAQNLKIQQLPNPDDARFSGRKTCQFRIVGKGQKQRIIRVPKYVLRNMLHYIEEDRQDAIDTFLSNNRRKIKSVENVWLTFQGNKPSIRTLEKVFERAGKKCCLDLHPHMFRHTFAIYQLSAMIKKSLGDESRQRSENGSVNLYKRIYQDPLRQLQKLMGHARISTTFIYLDYLDEIEEMLDEALANWTDSLF
jgi:site-specific recombinase XerD